MKKSRRTNVKNSLQHSGPSGIYDSNYHCDNNDSSTSNTGIPESRLVSNGKKKGWNSSFGSFLFRNRISSYALLMCFTVLFFFYHNALQAYTSVVTVDDLLDKHSNATNVFPIEKNSILPSKPIHNDDNIVLPTFSNLTSPESICQANVNNATRRKLNYYCRRKKCMQHKKETLLQTMNQRGDSNDSQSEKKSDTGGCKMLWFAAMYEDEEECNSSSTSRKRLSYSALYSVALNSALINARDTLQPVLILGRYGTSYENSTEPKKLGRWAETKGVKVLYSPRLSFQEDVDQGFLKKGITDLAHRQGPFLRLDIPKMIKEHGLLELPNVCKSHVLYTDVDVIFANDINMHDIQLFGELPGQGIASYGRQYRKRGEIINTGVMVINVKRLDEEMPKIVLHAKSKDIYPDHDQDMLNLYREKYDKANKMFSLLPMQYNWKAYWRLEPSTFSEVKIMHLHGPKPGRGLDEMSLCYVDAITSKSSSIPEPYLRSIWQGVCCDQGRTAKWSVDAIENLRAPLKDLCDDSQLNVLHVKVQTQHTEKHKTRT